MLKQLRFDPEEGAGSGSFSLDYLRLQEYDVKPVQAATEAGIPPVLPSMVTAIFAGGGEKQLAVNWESIDPSLYAAPGSFTVNGTIAASSVPVTATLIVSAKPMVWNFETNLEGWGNEFGISGFDWQPGGFIGGNVWYQDAQFFSPDGLGLDISRLTFVSIRLQNQTAATTGTIFFTTNENTVFDASKSKSIKLIPNDTGFTDYLLDMSDVSGWTGRLKQIRLDPEEGVTSGSFRLDSIRIGAPQERIDPVYVTTTAGVPPVLPSVVTSVYADQTRKDLAVVWSGIERSQYTSPGSFTVTGTVYGSPLSAKAVVTVKQPVVELSSWEFTNDNEGWGNEFGISNFGWKPGGLLSGDVWYQDAQFFSPDYLGTNLSTKKTVIISMQNQTAAAKGTFYFTTGDQQTFSEVQSKAINLVSNDSGFTTYTLDMSAVTGWTGVLKQIRFDPEEGITTGSFNIDYIHIV